MTRRPIRPIRRRVFMGCQGDSERSYGALLHQLVANTGRLHIDAVLLQPGAGDPLDTVKRACAVSAKRERDYGAPYIFRAVLLDRDQYGLCPERDTEIQRLVTAGKLHLIWQNPCHEGFLLRHIAGYQRHQPPTAIDAMARLKARWPDYEKAMPYRYLATKISVDDLRRVCTIETELRTFLQAIRYFP